MISDLKKFLLRGNVVDLAVAVIIGAAFNAIVKSFVNGVLMPPVGLLLGGVNFKDLKWVLVKATEKAPEVAILYGQFLQTVVDFLIIGTTVFVVVKSFEKLQKTEKPAPAAPSKTEKLLEEIRDLLKSQK